MTTRKETVNPEELIRPRIASIGAYHVEPYPCEVALDANESPYAPPPKLAERIHRAMGAVALNRYPDMLAQNLRDAIAAKEGVEAEEILLGNGSDEVIQCLCAATLEPGETVLVPSPTFSMYRQIAGYFGADTVEAPLREDWSLDLERMLDLMKDRAPKIIFLATPNNPTGTRFARAEVETVIENAPGLVVVDEAYVDFADWSFGPLFRQAPNVVVLKTLSKVGFAALRLGYMMADHRLSAGVNKTRLPYNINSITQAVAREVVEHWDWLKPLFGMVKKEREKMSAALKKTGWLAPYPSEANFILMRVDKDPQTVFSGLLTDGVRVRWFKDSSRLSDHFRVTVGTPEENARFLKSVDGIR
ncbi:MAG: histidinol-phosphate transaminase [Nitrospinae bacterium]|nr:histidinol-phosphate transaminase [Nitrospinota bacterium]